jgi:cytidylate kinase
MVDIHQLVHRQLLRWEAEARARREQYRPERQVTEPHPFVTVSREMGSLGVEVAVLVAEALHWPCMDRQVVDFVAKDMQVGERMISALDDHVRGYIEAWAASFAHGRHVESSDYVRHLARTIRALVQHGPVVIVGRGAHVILASLRNRGLSVRIIAPMEVRVKRVAAAEGISIEAARAKVTQSDQARDHFLRASFGTTLDAVHQFDLVVNTEHMDARQAAEVVLSAVRARGLDRPATSPAAAVQPGATRLAGTHRRSSLPDEL